MRHFQTDSLVAALDVEAFVRFGAVEDGLRGEMLACEDMESLESLVDGGKECESVE